MQDQGVAAGRSDARARVAEAAGDASSGRPILVVSDTGRISADVASALRGRSVLCLRPRHLTPAVVTASRLAVVDVDLRLAVDTRGTVDSLALLSASPSLYVIDSGTAGVVESHPRLVPDAVLMRPFAPEALAQGLADLLRTVHASEEAHTAHARGSASVPAEAADCLAAAMRALSDAYAAVAADRPIDLSPFGSAANVFVGTLQEAAASNHTLDAFLRAIGRHHSPTLRHSVAVAANAVLFGIELSLGRRELALIAEAALLHDIGKAVVPLEVLDKPDRLDARETALIRTHPSEGERLLREGGGSVSPEIARVVRHHHEYLDGSGYPDGLKADFIPDIVRLMTVADIFTALVEERPYKTPTPPSQALDVLRRMADDGRLDPVIVGRFTEMIAGRR